jgi:hypothetical protein
MSGRIGGDIRVTIRQIIKTDGKVCEIKGLPERPDKDEATAVRLLASAT